MLSTTNSAGPNAATNYPGHSAYHDGSAATDGNYGRSFAPYNAATGGSPIWGPDDHTAEPVSDGSFNVGLGSQTSGGIPTSVWHGDRCLEITLGGETVSPRELLRGVPVVGMALTVPDGAITNQKLALSHWSANPNRDPIDITTSASEVIRLELDFRRMACTCFSPRQSRKLLSAGK